MSEEREVKLVVVGDANVGKTSLLLRYCDDEFSESIVNISVDFKKSPYKWKGKDITLYLWDTAGQERYRTITSSFYRDTEAVILMYDITDEKSFKNLDKWIAEIDANVPFAEKIVVANKTDLDQARKISTESGQLWSEQKGLLFTESSAKTNENIKEAVNTLMESLLEKTLDTQRPTKRGVSLKRPGSQGKKRMFPCIV